MHRLGSGERCQPGGVGDRLVCNRQLLPGSAQRLAQQLPAQSPGIAITHMLDPTLYAGVEFGETDFTRAMRRPTLPQTAAEMTDITRIRPPSYGALRSANAPYTSYTGCASLR